MMPRILPNGSMTEAVIKPELPRLVHRALENDPSARLEAIEQAIDRVNRTQRWQSTVLLVLVILAAMVAGMYVFLLFGFLLQ